MTLSTLSQASQPGSSAPQRALRKPRNRARRESLHIADAGHWPDPAAALAQEAALKQEQKRERQLRKEAERAAERERRAAEEAAEHERRAAEEAAERERRAAQEAAEAEAAEKARLVLEELDRVEAADAEAAAAAVARQSAKKKARQDAIERKARRLSAAQWAERPDLAVWPCEAPLDMGAAVPLPPTPVQQRYGDRVSRARKVNSERRLAGTPRASVTAAQ